MPEEEVGGQFGKARDVKKAFETAANGLGQATQNKLTEYTLRALRGEAVADLTQGLPPVWGEEINKRLAAVPQLSDREQIWTEMQDRIDSVSSFDRKAFEYGLRIINGADREEVLQGIPPTLRNRVDTYMNESFKLAVEKASENQP